MRTAVIVFVALATACSHSETESVPATASSVNDVAPPTIGEPVARSTGKVIATVVTNNAKVSILSGQRVVVRKTDGTIVADGISVDELAAVDPMLHVLVRSAVASNEGAGGLPSPVEPYIDATNTRTQVHAGF